MYQCNLCEEIFDHWISLLAHKALKHHPGKTLIGLIALSLLLSNNR